MFKIEKFNKKQHNRDAFCCKNPVFNDYLKRFANQDSSNNRAKVYVVVQCDDIEPKKIYWYFTINAHSIASKDDFNQDLLHATYGYLPAILIGRLAIDKDQSQLRGYEILGQILIKCKQLSEEVGVSIVVVEPIDNDANKFYQRQVSISSKYLFYPISSIEI